jgi:nucleotide-binding universal stress UspA family protein
MLAPSARENAMISTPVPPGAIVVGVDGSPNSDLGLDWAMEEATRRGLPLHIIHAFSYGYPMTNHGIGDAVESLRHRGDGVCRRAVAHARHASPKLVITWDESTYGPAPTLVGASKAADTVVVGARGMSAARGVLMGSVSVQVAAHARCPVVVVRNTPAPAAAGAPVVVGVDGSALSTNAIAYAYAQASSRGVGLTVVHAWWLECVEGASGSAPGDVDWQIFAQEEHALVSQSLAGWDEKYPDVTVRRHSVRGLPVEALVRQSESACLVVMGTRGRGGFVGLVLGSVSQGVMHRAQCSVAIVHGPKEGHDGWDDIDTSAKPLLPDPAEGELT